jgi:hypothetical protein
MSDVHSLEASTRREMGDRSRQLVAACAPEAFARAVVAATRSVTR